MKQNHILKLFFALAITTIFLVQCSSQNQEQKPSQKVYQVALNWFPEPEHGGVYAALVHGYFKDAGVSVKILSGGPNAPVVSRIANQQVDFGIANADKLIYGKDLGMQIVATHVGIPNSPRCILLHKDSPHQSLKDLKNMTLQLNPQPAFSHYMQKHLKLENVKIIPYNGSLVQFTNDKNMGTQAYSFSEPVIAEAKGSQVKCLMVSELGYNLYTSLLITNSQLIKSHPEDVKKITKAIQKGWITYFKNPAKTHEHLKTVNKELTDEFLNKSFLKLKELVPTDFDGKMTIERWKTSLDQIKSLNLVKTQSLNAKTLFTNEILD